MTVRVQTFEFVSVLITLPTKVKIVTILTHPTILRYHLLAVKTLQLLILQELLLKYCLKLVVPSMILRKVYLIGSWPLEKTLLTYINPSLT